MPNPLKSCKFKLSYKEIIVPEYGFNLLLYFTKDIVAGIKKNSNAYKAGLRNGMKMVSFCNKSKEENLTVTILNAKKQKENITYQIEERKILIPYYN